MPSPESSQELAVVVVPLLLLACSFACDVLRFFFASIVLSSTGAGLILWVQPTFCAQVSFLTAVPTNNVLVRVRVLVPMLTFLPFLPSPFPFVPFLPPLPLLSTCIGSEVGLNFTANLLAVPTHRERELPVQLY